MRTELTKDFPVSLDPPLPVYLFNVIAGLRDKGVKTYPIKKVLSCTLVSISIHSYLLLAASSSLEDPSDVLRRSP